MTRWPRNRLVLALEVLVILPTKPPGAPWTALVADLEVPERVLYRLFRDLRETDIRIGSGVTPDGRNGYWLEGAGKGLREKLGLG